MTIAAHRPPPGPRGRPRGYPQEIPYALHVAKTELVGIEAARQTLGPMLERAADESTHFVLTRHGRPAGVLVDMAWYRQAREALKDPTDL